MSLIEFVYLVVIVAILGAIHYWNMRMVDKMHLRMVELNAASYLSFDKMDARLNVAFEKMDARLNVADNKILEAIHRLTELQMDRETSARVDNSDSTE